MKLIAHRGNLSGPLSDQENSPTYIDSALSLGFDAEIDLWYERSSLFLGHDFPQYSTCIEWLMERSQKLWIHSKSIETIFYLSHHLNLNYFFHNKDEVTLTSKNFLWTSPGLTLTSLSIDVMPELIYPKYCHEASSYIHNPYGVCTDFPINFEYL